MLVITLGGLAIRDRSFQDSLSAIVLMKQNALRRLEKLIGIRDT